MQLSILRRDASLPTRMYWWKEIVMKLLAPLTVALTLTAALPALAQTYDRKVTIVNNSGYTISYFYGSNVGTTFWEEDLLASDVLSNGASVVVNFDDTTGYCRFDLRAIFDDGTEIVQKDVNVCEIATFTINP
ncbi:MAG: hypothetical protein MUD11_14160 [Rhodobacteraceae bacterium]|nr:hypothetical protein [Paracoccaceae bacterium]